MGNFIFLTPWSDLFHYYQHKKRKMVLKGVNPSLWSEHTRVLLLWNWVTSCHWVESYYEYEHTNVPTPAGKLKYKIN